MPLDETQLPSVVSAQSDAVVPRPRNPETMKQLGQQLMKDFDTYKTDRRIAELKWAQNLRQYLGRYDDELEKKIPADRSKAYPKLTRWKCVSTVARLMNMLFPASEKNWTIAASPVPNLKIEDLQAVLDELQSDPQQTITDETITHAVMEFARTRARNLETEIEDQLTELGGSKMLSYVALCKRVLMSGVLFGMGVLKGPLAQSRTQRQWKLNPETNKVEAVDNLILTPLFEFVPLWDYYPDMSAKYLHQMDGQYQRVVMSREQVRKLANNSEFFGEAINDYLRTHQEGNYKQLPHEVELKALGVAINTTITDKRKYEALVWDGGLSAHYLKGCGLDVPEAKLHEMVKAVVWILDGVVIRASLNPWSMLDEDELISSFHQFVFEEDDTSLVGNGLPNIIRDSALGVAATTRMTLDNAGAICGPNVEVNRELLEAGTDTTGIHAYKVWVRDDDSVATMNVPAVRAITFDSHIPELLQVNELFRWFADQETFVNAANGGDMQQGPSEPFRTAAGASMLRGEMALPFKDVVRQFDVFTESVIGSLVIFNKHFNQKVTVRGDFQAVARGSTSLIAKEVRGMAYDELARSLTPGELMYIDQRKLLKARLSVRDMDQDIMVDDAEAKRREQAAAQHQQDQDSQMAQMFRAQLRTLLSEAVKNLTQADKNTAGAQATGYNAILDGLERGATPKDVADARAGHGGIPDGIITRMELENQPPPTPTKGGKK